MGGDILDYIFNVRAQFDTKSETQVLSDFLDMKRRIEKKYISINATLNTESISLASIQKQLNDEKLTINIGNVAFNNEGIKSAQGITDQLANSTNQATNAVNNLSLAYKNLSKQQVYNLLGAKNGLQTASAEMSVNDEKKGLSSITQSSRLQELERIQKTFEKVFGKNNIEVSGINDADGLLNKFTITARNAKDEVLNFSYALKAVKDNQDNIIGGRFENQAGTFGESSIKENIKAFEAQQKEIEKTNRTLSKQKDLLENIARQTENVRAANLDRKNPLNGVTTNADGLVEFTEQASAISTEFANRYNELQRYVQEYNQRIADGTQLTKEEVRELTNMLNTLRNIGQTAKAQQSTATSNRSKDVSSQIEAEKQNFAKFQDEIAKSDELTNKLSADLAHLKTLLEQANDAKSFGEYKDQLDAVRAKYERIKSEIKSISDIEKQLSSLERMTSTGVISKNSSETEVQELTNQVSQYRNEWNALNLELSKTNDSTHIEDIKSRMNALSHQIESTTENARQLKQSLTETANASKLATDKSNFSNKIDIWLQNNTKASDRLRQKMIQLKNELGNADDVKFTQLKKEFAELRNYAEATDQAGKSAFDTLKEKLGKFTGWFSIANVIMQTTQELKEAYNTLADIDDILTEISKTSDMSEQALKKLGTTAFDSAHQYGVTVQNYLTGVQEMSRAGYKEQAESMARMAILAEAAGDMEAQVAQDYLIATDAAYQLNGSEKELSKILDGQNEINIQVLLYGNI